MTNIPSGWGVEGGEGRVPVLTADTRISSGHCRPSCTCEDFMTRIETDLCDWVDANLDP